MAKNALIIFIKYPQPGKVKTRLAKGIGGEKSVLLYRMFVDALLKRTAPGNFQRMVFYSPANKKNEIAKWLGEDIRIYPQRGGALGDRLLKAFDFAFKNGAEKVIAIGSDSPLLDNALINRAFRCLRNKEIVVGPAFDGGYYLIGLSSLEKSLFQGISWGTEKVFKQTMEKIREKKKSHEILSVHFDVDRKEDIFLLRDKIKGPGINSFGLEEISDIIS